MKKKIAIIKENGATNEVLIQSEKVLQAIAEQYHHEFELIDTFVEDERPYFSLDSKGVITGSNAALAAGKHSIAAIEDEFTVFATVQPVALYPSLQHLSPLKQKNSEGLSLLIYQEQLSTADAQTRGRILKSAYQQARLRRQKITIIENADEAALDFSWKKIFDAQSNNSAEFNIEFLPLTEAIQRLVLQPSSFDVVITEKQSGFYFYQIAASLTGANGIPAQVMAADRISFFTPASAGEEKSIDTSNPLGSILSVALLLDQFQLREESLIVHAAVKWTILHGFVAKDIDPINYHSTTAIGDLVSDFIKGAIPGFSKGENMALHKSTII